MKTKFMKYALGYDKVVDFVFDENDYLTNRIIDYYKNYCLGLIPKIKYKIKMLDKIVNKYLYDIYFYAYVQNNMDMSTDLYYDLDDSMINLYRSYLDFKSRKIATSKWL